MPSKRQPARVVAKARGNGNYWIDHAQVHDEDIEWLRDSRQLTLWNVKLPIGFLAKLPNLKWLDIRGGSAKNLEVAAGVKHLEYLAVNQVRGLADLSQIASFSTLRLLLLYGLPQCRILPGLKGLRALERVEIGQMKTISSLGPILDAPNLRELLLIRKVNVPQSDIDRIVNHPSLREFDWYAEDVPDKIWVPVLAQIRLPQTRPMFPEEWFAEHAAFLEENQAELARG